MPEKPTPDGWVHIQLVNPINPWIDYTDSSDLPGDLEHHFNVRYLFEEIVTWKSTPEGVHILMEEQRLVYPWSNIHNLDVMYNSKKYQRDLEDFQLACDHDWQPQAGNILEDGAGENYQLCTKCEVTNIHLDTIRQKRIDEERHLRR